MKHQAIALLSDFGTMDVYVGVMKGVLVKRAPEAVIIDLTHEIPPGNVPVGAFRLWQAVPFMPAGTVFLAVVDPGVGTARRPLALATGDFSCVGPDIGLFTYMLAGRRDVRAVEIRVPPDGSSHAGAGRDDVHDATTRTPPAGLPVSSTFHGRDVFAPAAASLAAGVPIGELGPAASGIAAIDWPLLEIAGAGETAGPGGRGRVRGEVLCADRFGNLVTSIGRLRREGGALLLEPWTAPPAQDGAGRPDAVPAPPAPASASPRPSRTVLPAARLRVRLENGIELPLCRTFAEVPRGEALAYIGSDCLLEVGVNGGSAAERFRLAPGARVVLEL